MTWVDSHVFVLMSVWRQIKAADGLSGLNHIVAAGLLLPVLMLPSDLFLLLIFLPFLWHLTRVVIYPVPLEVDHVICKGVNDISTVGSSFQSASTGPSGWLQSCSRTAPGSEEGAAVWPRVRRGSQPCGRRPGAAVAERLQAGRAGGSTLQRYPGRPCQVAQLRLSVVQKTFWSVNEGEAALDMNTLSIRGGTFLVSLFVGYQFRWVWKWAKDSHMTTDTWKFGWTDFYIHPSWWVCLQLLSTHICDITNKSALGRPSQSLLSSTRPILFCHVPHHCFWICFSHPPHRFQTNFASLSEWLTGAGELLKTWSDLANACDLDQESIYTHLIKLLVRLFGTIVNDKHFPIDFGDESLEAAQFCWRHMRKPTIHNMHFTFQKSDLK